MPDSNDLPVRLRRLREHFDLTQQRVADLVDLDYKYYQKIEAGRPRRDMYLSTLARFARLYHLESWQLLHPDYVKFAKKPKER